MYLKIILCSEANAFDLDKFFQEKKVMKAKDVLFTRADFNKPLEECDLPMRIINVLKVEDINHIGELLQFPADQFKLLRNFGNTSLMQIREYVDHHYPSMRLGSLNHLLTLFWNFRDMYSLPHQPDKKKSNEINIRGYAIPINPSASIMVAEKISENYSDEMVVLHRIYQNGKREKTPINVKFLLGMTADSFIAQFNHLCNAKWMEHLKTQNN